MSNRFALIIANSQFDDPKLARLATPGRDAEALAALLADAAIGGFDVALQLDRPTETLRREIGRFYARKRREDLLLLYYSSHGLKDDHGQLYLATRDTETDLAGATALEAAFVRRQLDQTGSRRNAVILDCCHSGAFAGGGAKTTLGGSAGTREAFAGNGYGRIILTASNAVELAWEGDKLLSEAGLSVFTRFLVEGLQSGAADRDGDGQIALDELYEYVYDRVIGSGLSKQTPRMWVENVEGRLIIAYNPQAGARPAELPADLQQDIQSPYIWRREGAVSELKRLAQGDEPGLALAAREALQELVDDDSRRVSAAAALEAIQGAEATPSSTPTGQDRQAGAKPAHLPSSVPISSDEGGTDPASAAKREAVQSVATSRDRQVTDAAGAASPQAGLEVLTLTQPIRLDLIRIPAGEFLMGSDPAKDKDAQKDEQPQHRVYVSEFYLGKYPVTNEQYAAFVKAAGHRPPAGWPDGRMPAKKANHPVVGLAKDDALAFCDWLRRETGRPFRLPTEAEWEKAARGTDGRLYPWGNQPADDKRLNFNQKVGGDTSPVGRYSPLGDSPYGLADMSGNVWELTADRYNETEYQGRAGGVVKDPQGPAKGDLWVWRGGSWWSQASDARCARRNGRRLLRLRDNGVRVAVGGAASSSDL